MGAYYNNREGKVTYNLTQGKLNKTNNEEHTGDFNMALLENISDEFARLQPDQWQTNIRLSVAHPVTYVK